MKMELNRNIPNINYFIKSPKSRCTERHIKLRFPELYQELQKYDNCSKFTERLYRYYHNIQNNPICPICGKKVRFWNFIDGYSTYCSYKCMYKSQDRQDAYKRTCMERYGVENASQCERLKEKRKETTRKHYGVDYSLASPVVREKGRKTCLEKYGTEYVSQVEEIKQKVKETTRKHYGVDYSLASSIVREKGRKTMLKKYGVEYNMQSPILVDKMKQNNLIKYGYEWTSQNPDILNKIKQTFIEKYGYESILKNPLIREKIKKTMFERYGVENTKELWDSKNNDNEKVIDARKYIINKIYQIKKDKKSLNSSKIERKFKHWLDDNNIKYEYQYKSDNYPFNCDFYFPDRDLYLEIQGYWSHGGHPFNSNNQQDIEKIEKWKSKQTKLYDSSIETWTIRDPMKRQWARDHNLNWHEVFTTKLDILIKYMTPLLF